MARISVKSPDLGFEIEAEGGTEAVLNTLAWVREFAKKRRAERDQTAAAEASLRSQRREAAMAEYSAAVAALKPVYEARVRRANRSPKEKIKCIARAVVRTTMYWERRHEWDK